MLDVLQIGASRAGSTWLWRMFQKHPDVIFPVWGPNAAPRGGPAYSRKSGWFWNNTSPFWKDNHWGQIKPRAIMNLDEYRKWYDSNVEGKIKVDITEGAAYIPETRIQLIRDTYPDVKIAYCIRNPITTTWSHMTFSKQQNLPVQKFLEQRGGNYKRNVDYLNNINHWKKYFPKEQVFVYFYFEIRDNPISLLEELSEYFGVDTTIWRTLPEKELKAVVNPSRKGKMPDKVREVLVRKYKPLINEMGDYFEKDFSRWLQGKE